MFPLEQYPPLALYSRMPKDFFAFKQFRIQQDACAMKVSTDACILGAWAPIPEGAQRACDIGSGTGLLALMLAQRSAALKIDAIEIDTAASQQAEQNIHSSPFADRLSLIRDDIRRFVPHQPYDFIICNPPFFENSLRSSNEARMQARHTDSLSYRELAGFIAAHLSPDGLASVLLPAAQEQSWLAAISEFPLELRQQLSVQPMPHKDYNRMVFVLGKQKGIPCSYEDLLIYQEAGIYTAAFTLLLSPFYLHL